MLPIITVFLKHVSQHEATGKKVPGPPKAQNFPQEETKLYGLQKHWAKLGQEKAAS